jgi:hypothetical protein
MGQWVFGELRGADVRRGPQEALLFKTEQAGEGEYAGNDHLVREVLQNAIDARAGEEPVRVRFAIHEASEAPAASRIAHYFRHLRPALAGKIEFDEDTPKQPCRYLVCEDFGTRGLEGNVELFENPNAPGEDFFWFWRNIGLSGKTGMDLGRWGLGKTVFRAVSRAGCMFGLTLRRSDHKRLLMGQAVLQIHMQGAKEFQPEGFWCGALNAAGLPLPISDSSELALFASEWRLSRQDQPGTSIVSPFIPAELRADRLMQAVAVHFFTRILRGEMVVEVEGKETGVKRLDRASIEAVCKEIRWDGSKRSKRHAPPPIAFARTCLKSSPTAITEILGKSKIPSIIDEGALSKETLDVLRRKFAACDQVGLQVNLHLPRKVGADCVGQVNVFLKRSEEGEKCDAYFVREGMTITKLNSRAGARGIQALVIVDPGPLAELLGDTEGPAHEDWDTSEERPDRNWKTWKGRVTFVRKIVDHVVELLTPVTSEPDFDLLSDFFSIEQATGPQRHRQPGGDKKDRPVIDMPDFTPKWYHIKERVGGFTVARNVHVPMPEGAVLKVAVAYDLPRGDPLRNWNALDFEIGGKEGQLTPLGKGMKPRRLAGNRVELRELEPDFSFAVNGFDEHRDLFIRVEEAVAAEEVSV